MTLPPLLWLTVLYQLLHSTISEASYADIMQEVFLSLNLLCSALQPSVSRAPCWEWLQNSREEDLSEGPWKDREPNAVSVLMYVGMSVSKHTALAQIIRQLERSSITCLMHTE